MSLGFQVMGILRNTHVYISIYTHTYIYTYIHTHTHINDNPIRQLSFCDGTQPLSLRLQHKAFFLTPARLSFPDTQGMEEGLGSRV